MRNFYLYLSDNTSEQPLFPREERLRGGKRKEYLSNREENP